MKTKRIIRILVIMLILISNISCDQVSKSIVRKSVEYHERIGLIDPYVTLTKVENTGAFLSMGNSLPDFLKTMLLIILPLLALAFGLLFLLIKTEIPKNMLLGLCFVIGGGIGNIYDRIMFGSVTDFLHIDFVLFQTGIFNMADVSIMVGYFLILIYSFNQKPSLI